METREACNLAGQFKTKWLRSWDFENNFFKNILFIKSKFIGYYFFFYKRVRYIQYLMLGVGVWEPYCILEIYNYSYQVSSLLVYFDFILNNPKILVLI